MRTLVIQNADLSDTIFELTAEGWPSIVWNVTRLQRDAAAGRFGPPVRLPVSGLPPMNDGNRANVDWRKAEAIALGLLPGLDEPLLSVVLARDGALHRFPVDGNHRLAAKILLKAEFYETYQVPPEIEGNYRVTEAWI